MAYRLKQDLDSILHARTIISAELGEEAWELSTQEVVGYSEMLLNSMAGAAANIMRQARPIEAAVFASPLGSAAKVLGCYPRSQRSPAEQLHALTQ